MPDIRKARRIKQRQRLRKLKRIDLSGPGQAREDDPDTAKAAAMSIDAKKLREQVVLVHLAAGSRGLTGDEMHSVIGAARRSLGAEPYARDSLYPRRPELEREGLLEKNGRKRSGRKGRAQEVWIATDKARQQVN